MSHPKKPVGSAASLLPSIHAKAIQLHYTAHEVKARTRRIYETMLRESRQMSTGNFESIHTEDLERLYPLYDREFFGGILATLINDVHRTELTFRLSSRMTSAAGKTIRTRRSIPTPSGRIARTDYEIAISTVLLFQTFGTSDRPTLVCGLECQNRLDALLRVFEHESIHLLEMLLWGDSNCDAQNFQSLAARIFGHKGVRHALITPRERAATEFTLQVGDFVRFEYEGQTLRGILNRITRRASILVPSPEGRTYSNGEKYITYYVPLEALTKDS